MATAAALGSVFNVAASTGSAIDAVASVLVMT